LEKDVNNSGEVPPPAPLLAAKAGADRRKKIAIQNRIGTASFFIEPPEKRLKELSATIKYLRGI